jgi:hypothetical protein
MARKFIPAHPSRDRSRDDESLLLRSAESLGRMIGSLQRQLDVATGRIAASRPDGKVRNTSGAKRSVNAKSGTSKSRGSAQKRSSAVKPAARRSAKKR